mmetsp:Transcript_34507/g.73636  ORF Transcript_34507/g.73636 Transcript_34507/m.73636 type:complete len:214 (-) Transcript_34507:71-712(-)
MRRRSAKRYRGPSAWASPPSLGWSSGCPTLTVRSSTRVWSSALRGARPPFLHSTRTRSWAARLAPIRSCPTKGRLGLGADALGPARWLVSLWRQSIGHLHLCTGAAVSRGLAASVGGVARCVAPVWRGGGPATTRPHVARLQPLCREWKSSTLYARIAPMMTVLASMRVLGRCECLLGGLDTIVLHARSPLSPTDKWTRSWRRAPLQCLLNVM